MIVKTSKSAVIKIAVGLLFILACLVFLYFRIGNQLNELSLIRHGHTITGHIINCTEKLDTNDYPYHYCDYTFTLPDGRTFNSQSITMPGEVKEELADLKNPYPAEIEYIADNPEISKIKNTGSTNFFNWTWHTFGSGIIIIFILAFPGLLFLAEGIKELIKV